MNVIREQFEDYYRQKWERGTGFWVDRYPAFMSLYADLCRQRNEAILSYVPHGLVHALDVGCGVGDLTLPLSQKVQRVTGVEIAFCNAVLAKKNLAKMGAQGVEFALASVEELPFKRESVDCVVIADVIEHVVDRQAAMKEIHRVLSKHGRAIVVTPDKFRLETIEKMDEVAMAMVQSVRKAWRTLKGKNQTTGTSSQTDVYEKFLAYDELSELAAATGFREVTHRHVGFYPGPEGGGTFGMFLSVLRHYPTFRTSFVEPLGHPLFRALAKLEVCNQKQLLVVEKNS